MWRQTEGGGGERPVAACAPRPTSKPSPYTLYTSRSPNATFQEPQHFKQYGSERVTIKYGPFLVPAGSANNGMKTFNVPNAAKPCDNCLITSMLAGLEYTDGTVANSDTGMWLHHVVLYNTGRRSASCAAFPDRFFASGNERTVIDIAVNGTQKTGYFLSGSDGLYVLAELMNEMDRAREAVVSVTFEFIPYVPGDFSLATPVWLDITGVCGNSEAPVPTGKPTFSLAMSPPWTSNLTGRVTFAGTHLHDGGVTLRLLGDNRTVCDGVARYGEAPGYVEGMNTTTMCHDEELDLLRHGHGAHLVHVQLR